jgi:AhpD family alkylhydroperoxidase
MAIRAVVRRRFGHVVGPVAVTAHHPRLLSAYATFELLLERSHRIDRRLEELAATLASNRTGCPFCIDFAAALARHVGIAPEKVAELDRWRDSDVYSDDERLVLEYADGMCQTPVEVDEALFARLAARFDPPAIVELTAAIAFENYRGRFNHALGLGSEGFCDRK